LGAVSATRTASAASRDERQCCIAVRGGRPGGDVTTDERLADCFGESARRCIRSQDSPP
jgi:hypothetical protein